MKQVPRLERWTYCADIILDSLIELQEKSKSDTSSPSILATIVDWPTLRKLFKYYCIFGRADLRKKMGTFLSTFISDLTYDWVIVLLEDYFSSNSPHSLRAASRSSQTASDIFELIFSMIPPEIYNRVVNQLFTLLQTLLNSAEKNKSNNNNSNIDIGYISWVLLFLSKLLSYTTEKSSLVHFGSKCRGCGTVNISGVR